MCLFSLIFFALANGQYLGRDDAPTSRVRIITDDEWAKLPKDENGVAFWFWAHQRSEMFSYASTWMADQAILNVYQHILDSWGVITSPIKMIINNEIGNGVLMQLQAVISNNELQDLTLFIQQVTMSGLLNINNFLLL